MIKRVTSVDGYMNEEAWAYTGGSTSVAANGTIYFSGIAAIGPDMEVVAPGDMVGQLRFAMEVLERGLAQHGADVSHLVSLVVYTTDEEALSANWDVIGDKVRANPPVTTSIGVASLAMPGLVVEVVAIAAT